MPQFTHGSPDRTITVLNQIGYHSAEKPARMVQSLSLMPANTPALMNAPHTDQSGFFA
jgi:hypothetical protein